MQHQICWKNYSILFIGVGFSLMLRGDCCMLVIRPPSNKAVLQGSQVHMKCTINGSYLILWRRTAAFSSMSSPVTIYTGSKFAGNFGEVYSINKTVLGQFDLSMTASLATAGRYICEATGINTKETLRIESAELIVIVAHPVCLVRKISGLSSKLECRLRMTGHWLPEMNWLEEYFNESRLFINTSDIDNSNQQIVSKLTVDVEEFQRKFTCVTKFTAAGKPLPTTATNIPDYQQNCSVIVNGRAPIVVTHTSVVNATQSTHVSASDTSDSSTERTSLPSTPYNSRIFLIVLPVVLGLLIVLPIIFWKKAGIFGLACSKKTDANHQTTRFSEGSLSENQSGCSVAVKPTVELATVSTGNYEDVSSKNVMVHDSLIEKSSHQLYVNTASQSQCASSAEAESSMTYTSLEQRKYEPTEYATLNTCSDYENPG